MGRLFLVEFDQITRIRSYICRCCQTHIALTQDSLSRFPGPMGEGYFTKVVNVVTDEPGQYYRTYDNSLVADSHCVNCNMPLGVTYIDSHAPGIVNEIVMLNLSCLLFWNGTRLLHADTLRDANVRRAAHQQQG